MAPGGIAGISTMPGGSAHTCCGAADDDAADVATTAAIGGRDIAGRGAIWGAIWGAI